MFTTEEILSALQSGADPEQIAKDFTNNLNAAIKTKKEAEAKASKVKEDRIFELEQIIDSIADFIEKFYPDMYHEDMFDQLKVEELDKVIEDAYHEVNEMFSQLNDLKKKVAAVNRPTVAKSNSADDAIKRFFTKYNL